MISLIASLILATHTGDSQVDYVLDCMAVEIPYQRNKYAAGPGYAVLEAALHCQCMYDTEMYVGQISGGPLPVWTMDSINHMCRRKVKALLTSKKEKPCPNE